MSINRNQNIVEIINRARLNKVYKHILNYELWMCALWCQRTVHFAHLVERLLPSPEIGGSNPAIELLR